MDGKLRTTVGSITKASKTGDVAEETQISQKKCKVQNVFGLFASILLPVFYDVPKS